MRFGHGRKVGVHARRRVRHVLTKKLLPHEQAARCRGGFIGLGRECQKQALPQQSGTL